jgi:O-antigen ligase
MLSLLRSKKFEPLMLLGLLWPLALVAPFVPGLPRPQLSGLSWRQELVMALVLASTLAALLFHRKLRAGTSLALTRRELFLNAALLLFIAWSALSLLWAANPYPVLHYIFVWGIYFLFFLLMRRAASKPRLLAASLLIFAAAIFIISLASIIGAMGASISLFRYHGLGEPLAVSVPLLTVLALGLRRRGSALLCGLVALCAWLAMLQAYERTPFISTTAGLILLMLLLFAFPRLRPRGRGLRLVILPACFVLVTALQFMPSFTSRFGAPPPFTVYSRLQSTNASDENTLARLLFWNAAFEMVREHPVKGVGANHYGIAFPEARARFAASHPDSKLTEMLEGHLAAVAHNEYLQILAELGVVGFALFALFALLLIYTAWLALKRSRSPLVAGAVSALAVFAINSGASSISFRWLASGLIFFFAAAIVTRLASSAEMEKERTVSLSSSFVRGANAVALCFAVILVLGMSAQALSVIRSGQAQDASNASRSDELFRVALFWNRWDGPTHFTYGQWLYQQRRFQESIPHLRFGIRNGVNTSLCYAYLSSAEMKTGQATEAEGTLNEALKVYPRSVFLRVSRASLLSSQAKQAEADEEMSRALSINERDARGWWALINYGKEEATRLAIKEPKSVSAPGSLLPYDAVLFVLSDKEELTGMDRMSRRKEINSYPLYPVYPCLNLSLL